MNEPALAFCSSPNRFVVRTRRLKDVSDRFALRVLATYLASTRVEYYMILYSTHGYYLVMADSAVTTAAADTANAGGSSSEPGVTDDACNTSTATSQAEGKRPYAAAADTVEPSCTGSDDSSKRQCVPTWGASRDGEAAPPIAPPIARDELTAAAPKLAAAIRSTAKCVKVAEKVASLLEDGQVKISNAGAVFEVFEAAVEDPMRWRKPAMRAAYRRLFSAADARLSLFPLQQQQSIKIWRLRVVTLIDLLSSHPEQFANAFTEMTMKMRRLQCDNPANEPRSSAQPGFSHLLTGAGRDYLPERTRPAWCNAIFECLDAVVTRFEGPQLWARAEVNTLVKLAAERRRNFARAQQEVLDKWEGDRKAHPATRQLEYAKFLQDKPVL